MSNFDDLCHTERDHPTNFYISLEVLLLSLLTEQMTSRRRVISDMFVDIKKVFIL